jgi:hypothetical protein
VLNVAVADRWLLLLSSNDDGFIKIASCVLWLAAMAMYH